MSQRKNCKVSGASITSLSVLPDAGRTVLAGGGNFSSFHYILVIRIVEEISEYDCTILTLGSERLFSDEECTKRDPYHC